MKTELNILNNKLCLSIRISHTMRMLKLFESFRYTEYFHPINDFLFQVKEILLFG